MQRDELVPSRDSDAWRPYWESRLVADLDAIDQEQVPEFLVGIFTLEEWRQLRAIAAFAAFTFACDVPVGEENARRHKELYAKFKIAALDVRLVKMIETKFNADGDLSWAEVQVLAVAKDMSEPRSNSERAWDAWYEQPIWQSLSRYVPERFEARRDCAPRVRRGRRTTSRNRARAPARPGEDPEPLDQALERAANRKEAA